MPGEKVKTENLCLKMRPSYEGYAIKTLRNNQSQMGRDVLRGSHANSCLPLALSLRASNSLFGAAQPHLVFPHINA